MIVCRNGSGRRTSRETPDQRHSVKPTYNQEEQTIVHHSSCNKNFQKSKTTLKIVFISYSVNVDEDGQDERGSHGDQGQRSQPGQTGEQVEVGTRRGREIHCACAKANIVWIFQPIGGLDGKKRQPIGGLDGKKRQPIGGLDGT